MEEIKKLKKKIDDIVVVRKSKIADLESEKKKLKKVDQDLKNSNEALLIMQTVAKKTQQQLEMKISNLVSLSLSIFPDPVKFQLEYTIKRNKTEAELWFVVNDHKINPIKSGGHGHVDVAGFALRCAMWSIKPHKLDNVIWFDEPFKNINDRSREAHRKVASMIKQISDKQNIQFIITSQIPELEDVADRVFEVSRVKGQSEVRVL
jgi:DNA repair exonuclease SbcCD ATPase subunit